MESASDAVQAWIFDSHSFPIWVSIHSFWCCHWIYRATAWRAVTRATPIFRLLVSFLVAHIPIELVLLTTPSNILLHQHPSLILIHVSIWTVYELLGHFRWLSLIDSLTRLLAFIEGVYLIKIVRFALAHGRDPIQRFLGAVVSPNTAFLIELPFRSWLGWNETPFTDFFSWIRTVSVAFLFWLTWVVQPGVLKPYSSVTFALIQGFLMVFSRQTADSIERLFDKIRFQADLLKNAARK
jgi:hypothetical protein